MCPPHNFSFYLFFKIKIWSLCISNSEDTFSLNAIGVAMCWVYAVTEIHASDLYSGARDVDQKGNELFLCFGSGILAVFIANVGAVPVWLSK